MDKGEQEAEVQDIEIKSRASPTRVKANGEGIYTDKDEMRWRKEEKSRTAGEGQY